MKRIPDNLDWNGENKGKFKVSIEVKGKRIFLFDGAIKEMKLPPMPEDIVLLLESAIKTIEAERCFAGAKLE